jgi:hypothetical protein
MPIDHLFKQPWTVMILEPQIGITHPYFFFFFLKEEKCLFFVFFFFSGSHALLLFEGVRTINWPPFTTRCTERTYSSIDSDRTPLRFYLLVFPWWHSISFDCCVASLLYKGPSNLQTFNLEPRSTITT